VCVKVGPPLAGTLRNDLPDPHVVKPIIAAVTTIMVPVMPTMTPTIRWV